MKLFKCSHPTSFLYGKFKLVFQNIYMQMKFVENYHPKITIQKFCRVKTVEHYNFFFLYLQALASVV